MLKEMSSFAKVMCILFVCLTIIFIVAMLTNNLNVFINAFTFSPTWWEINIAFGMIILFILLI